MLQTNFDLSLNRSLLASSVRKVFYNLKIISKKLLYLMVVISLILPNLVLLVSTASASVQQTRISDANETVFGVKKEINPYFEYSQYLINHPEKKADVTIPPSNISSGPVPEIEHVKPEQLVIPHYTTPVAPLIIDPASITACATSGDLVIGSSETCKLDAGSYTYDSILVESGGILVTVGDTTSGTGVVINATSVTVELGGRITADGLGYQGGVDNQAGDGPGGGVYVGPSGTGGGYGGPGASRSGVSGGQPYGSAREPVDLGSGGGDGANGYGGDGGGALKIVVSDTITIDGIISANGERGYSSGSYAGAGAGGSVWIDADTIGGSGSIATNGQAYGAEGGGGRIAFYYNSSTFNLDTDHLQAYGAGAGTIFLKEKDVAFEKLIIDNNNRNQLATYLVSESQEFDELLLSRSGHYRMFASASEIFQFDSMTINGSTLYASPFDSEDQDYGNDWPFYLEVDTLSIDSGGHLSSNGLGYKGGVADGEDGYGPGGGGSSASNRGGGGGYGGPGASVLYSGSLAAGGEPYGLPRQPDDLGSGGAEGINGRAGNGGGALKLIISDTLTLDGVISADGEQAYSAGEYSGAGSGGSVWIDADTITGSGLISASGHRTGVDGGGGRIAVYYISSNLPLDTAHIQATGAGAGTIYIKEKGSSFETMIIDNNNFNGLSTYIDTESKEFDELTLSRGGNFELHAGFGEIFNYGNLTVDGATLYCYPYESGDTVYTNDSPCHIEADNITITASGEINADSLGYPGVPPNNIGIGPGGGNHWSSTYEVSHAASGAGYGGYGATQSSEHAPAGGFYGDYLAPTLLGSSGGSTANWTSGAGGGAIYLDVSDTLTLDGLITANGGSPNGTQYAGGGSGGSVFIETGTLAGSGLITANGGWARNQFGDALPDFLSGGGGRIAIFHDSESAGNVSAEAYFGAYSAPTGIFAANDGSVCWGYLGSNDCYN